MFNIFIIMMSNAELPHAGNYKLSLRCVGSLKLDVICLQSVIYTTKFKVPGMIDNETSLTASKIIQA